MFFCRECADRNKWPESIFTSYGKCECCGHVRVCNDVPSRFLPSAPKETE